MSFFVHKPETVEAIQYDGTNFAELDERWPDNVMKSAACNPEVLYFRAKDAGLYELRVGDWIMQTGSLVHKVSDAVVKRFYEPAPDPNAWTDDGPLPLTADPAT